MSRTAKATGALLLGLVFLLFFGGWRLYDHAMHNTSPRSLGEQFIEAMNQNDLARANKLLDMGVDVSIRQPYSNITCLMAAARMPDSRLLQRLIRQGADVNAEDSSGSPALVYLLMSGRATPALVKLLLPNHVHLRPNAVAGASPLGLAIQTRDPQIIADVLDAGANANEKDAGGKPVLDDVVEADDLATVKKLVAHGASVNVRGPLGERPLLTALNLGDDAMAQYLLAHGADVNVQDKDGSSALLCAVANNLPGSFAALLARGARTDTRNKKGETALIVAAREGRVEMAGALLRKHADITIKDATTRTAAAWAKDQVFTEIEKMLRQHGESR